MLEDYLQLLEKYKHPKLSYLFSSLAIPQHWQVQSTANKIDCLKNQTDCLIDLYHYREITKLLSLDQIEKLESQFSKDLNEEEFILMLLLTVDIPPEHMPYLINGARLLYSAICWQNQIFRVSFDAFVNYYYICQQESRNEVEGMFTNDQKSQLRQFQQFKKEKHGFVNGKKQDIVHHNEAIKRVFYQKDWIIALDEMSDYFRMYDSETMNLLRRVKCTSKRHKNSEIHMLDLYWADGPKNVGVCCQDQTISLWTLMSKFEQEYTFSTVDFGLQVHILYLETVKAWITVNQENKLIQWKFTYMIESSDNKMGVQLTNASTATGVALSFQGDKISCLKEVLPLKKLFIGQYNQTITIWNPIKQSVFAVIELPAGRSSAHTITFSTKLQIIFSVGWDQDVVLWQLDEVNEDYNKVGQITISEAGSSVSALEVFDEYGLLITLDDLGIMRCWDIELWTIIYRFDLNCKIKHTLSMIVKLELGRFLLTTSRLHIMEFSSHQARKVKAKFKPLDGMQLADSFRIYIGSWNQVYGFNCNNGLVEEKLSTCSIYIQYFYIVQDIVLAIGDNAILYVLNQRQSLINPNPEQGFKAGSDFQEYILFEDPLITGSAYHKAYCQLTVWNQNLIRIFQVSYINKEINCQKIKQILTTNEIIKVINMPERNIITILLRNNSVYFLSYNHLRTINIINLDDDIIDLYVLRDYSTIIVHSYTKIYFLEHTNFMQVRLKYAILQEAKDAQIISLNYQGLDNILEEFYSYQMKFANSAFFKTLESINQNKYMPKQSNYTFSQKMTELRQKNNELNCIEKRSSAILKFKGVVGKVIQLIRAKSFEVIEGKYSFTNMDSIESGSSMSSPSLPKKAVQLLQQFTFDYPEESSNEWSKYSFHVGNILQDFESQYFLVLRDEYLKLVNLERLLQDFNKINEPYRNMTEVNKLYITLDENVEIHHISTNYVKRMNVEFLEIQHNSIYPEIINYYGNQLLLTFGREDNTLKLWDISNIKSQYQLQVSKKYQDSKCRIVAVGQKLKELMETQTNPAEVELQEQIQANLTKQINDLVRYEQLYNPFGVNDQVYLLGEYLLTLELRIKWDLKDYNSTSRINQVLKTFKLMKKMLINWQEANKYQSYQLEYQIQGKLRLHNTLKNAVKYKKSPARPTHRWFNDILPQKSKPNMQSTINRLRLQTSFITNCSSSPKRPSNHTGTGPGTGTLNGQKVTGFPKNVPKLDDPYKLEEIQCKVNERIDNIAKSSKKMNQLNKQFNDIYFPDKEHDSNDQEKKKKILKKPNYLYESPDSQLQKLPSLTFIKQQNISELEQIEILRHYDFNREANRQAQSVRDIIIHNKVNRSLTPLKNFLKKGSKHAKH